MASFSSVSVFDFALQFSQYKFGVERNFLILQGQINGRADGQIREFYRNQSSELEPVQSRLDSTLAAKDTIAEKLENLRRARERIIDIKGALAEAAAAAQAGKRADFDNALYEVNLEASLSRADPDNLIGQLGAASRGSRIDIVSLPNNDVTVQTQSLATTYTVQLTTGEQITPDVIANSVVIGGTKFDLPALSYVSHAGDDVTFDAGGTSYTGTVSRGGLGVMHSYYYGDLPADGSAASIAHRQRAIDDVNAALSTVRNLDKQLAAAEIEIARGFGQVEIESEAVQGEMNDLVLRQRDEEKAFNRALQVRTQVALSAIALAAKTAETMLSEMFAEDPPLTDTILDKFGFGKKSK